MKTEKSTEGTGFEISRFRQEAFRQFRGGREFVSLDDETIDRIARRVVEVQRESVPVRKETLTSPEAMELLGYSGRSDRFLQNVRSQRIPHIKINPRHFVFNRASLLAWMERRNPVKGL